MIFSKIEEYEKMHYYVADSTSEAILYASPKSGIETDLPMTSSMRYPPQYPRATSKSVIAIL